jgi:hypothetical protein
MAGNYLAERTSISGYSITTAKIVKEVASPVKIVTVAVTALCSLVELSAEILY